MNTCALKERNKNKNENCGPNSVCTNKIVKYRCSCQLGFGYVDDVIRICSGKYTLTPQKRKLTRRFAL